MNEKILVTGALGNVGQWVLTELVKQGKEVVAFDIKTPKTEKKQAQLVKNMKFETIWGDLSDESGLKKIITDTNPDVIIHVAAILAPVAYTIPNIAYKVNVLGSRYLIEAAEKLENLKRFVFVSSYSIHGPQNPHKNPPALTGDSERNPGDTYGKHKVWTEMKLEKSSLDWVIIRLPAVMSVDFDMSGVDPAVSSFVFLLDPNRTQSGIDARDAGLAIANASSIKEGKRKFDICGDPDKGWVGQGRDITGRMIKAMGMGDLPDSAYRLADPELDDSWYYEGRVDPTESQKVLQYQRYSMDETIGQIMKNAGIMKYILKIIGPLVKRSMLKNSHFYGKPSEPRSSSIWEELKVMYKMDEKDLPSFQDGFFDV